VVFNFLIASSNTIPIIVHLINLFKLDKLTITTIWRDVFGVVFGVTIMFLTIAILLTQKPKLTRGSYKNMRKTIIILTFCLAIQIKDIIPNTAEPTIPTISFNQTIQPAAISIEYINNSLKWDSTVNNKETTIIYNKLNTSTENINGGDYNLTNHSSNRIQKPSIIISSLLNSTVNIVNKMNSLVDKLSTQAHNNYSVFG
jgi:hypothetical protein